MNIEDKFGRNGVAIEFSTYWCFVCNPTNNKLHLQISHTKRQNHEVSCFLVGRRYVSAQSCTQIHIFLLDIRQIVVESVISFANKGDL